jgi:hypothetical protein
MNDRKNKETNESRKGKMDKRETQKEMTIQ